MYSPEKLLIVLFSPIYAGTSGNAGEIDKVAYEESL